MNIQNKGFLSIEQLQDQYLKKNKSAASAIDRDGKSFQEVLESSRARAAEY